MKKIVAYLLLITFTFSQSEEKNENYVIETFCKTPIIGKMNMDINYSFNFGSGYYDDFGKSIHINEYLYQNPNLENRISTELKASDSVNVDNLANFFNYNDGNNLSQHSINLRLDYYGIERMGIYANFDLRINNNRLITVNEENLLLDGSQSLTMNVDKSYTSNFVELGFYYIWENIFGIQRIRQDFLNVIIFENTLIFGTKFSFDYDISNKLRFTNKLSVSLADSGKFKALIAPTTIVTTDLKTNSDVDIYQVSLKDTVSFDFDSYTSVTSLSNEFRVIYDINKKMALSLDLVYISRNINGVPPDTKTGFLGVPSITSNAFIIRPQFGYNIIGSINYGFLNFDSITINPSITMPIFGKNILQLNKCLF